MQNEVKKYDVGVVVGRFQVHELHPGHRELLDWVNENHDTMIVMLGSSHIASRTNPLPFNARRVMIQEMYPDAIIAPIYDQRSDENWSEDLDSNITRLVRPTESVCLYGSRDGFVEHYTGNYATQKLVATEPFWSGSEVRESIINKVRSSVDFRAGVIYAQGGTYPKVIPTVDAIVFSTSKYEDMDSHHSVYMVRKNGEDKFRFPGGYAEPGSNYLATARREIGEEVGDIAVEDLRYLGDTEIEDWRYGQRDIIHTTVFIGSRSWGKVGNFTDTDEIAEVREFTTTNLLLGYKDSVVPEHHVIVEMLKEYLDNYNKMYNVAKETLDSIVD